MPALATRARRLALACALITAATLGTVSASAATESESSESPDGSGGTSEPSPHSGRHHGGHWFGLRYEPTDSAPDDVNEANDDFAACVRDEGQEVYPDFRAYKDDDGEVRLEVTMEGRLRDLDRDALDGFRDALKECAPIMEKAGLSHPDGDDLPDRPKLPDRPGCDEAHERVRPERGQRNDEGDRPSLVTGVLGV
ncbi:hypothetical protein [Streptomyces sp. NPDC002845]